MHKHGYRPEAIIYLLNLLFEVLLAVLCDHELLKIFQLVDIGEIDLKSKINEILKTIINKPENNNEIDLENEAIKLDKMLSEIQSNSLISDTYAQSLYTWILKFKKEISSNGIINQDMLKRSEEGTFKRRFNEVKNIAFINKLIYYLLIEENDIQIELIIEKIQKSLDDFDFRSSAHSRFDLVQDFIWMITGSIRRKEKLQNNVASFLKLNESDFTNQEDKDLIKKATEIENSQLSNEFKFQPLRSAGNWLIVRYCYEELKANNLKSNTQIGAMLDLGIARSCLHLGKYSKVIKTIESNTSNSEINSSPELWYLGATALRKQCQYGKATKFIKHSIKLMPNNDASIKESNLIKKFLDENTSQYKNRIRESKKAINFNDSMYYSRIHERPSYYNKLSLDGGGVKGVISCVFLNEIESRLKRPISHLFNMIAGTSTGAIIGTALSLPKTLNGLKVPLFSASEIVQLYSTESAKVFSEKRNLIQSIYKPRYYVEKKNELVKIFSIRQLQIS